MAPVLTLRFGRATSRGPSLGARGSRRCAILMFRSSLAMGPFRATSRAAFLKPSFQPHVGPLYVHCREEFSANATSNAQYAFKWVPSLFFWGASAGVLVTLALSGVPLFKKDVLLNTPVASFYEDKTPDSDKPF